MTVNYTVPGTITKIDQGKSNLCWLATTTMLLASKVPVPMDMKTTAKRLGPEFEALLSKGAALRGDLINLFQQRAGIISLAGQSRPATAWEALLKSKGLLAVGIDADEPNNFMAHLVMLYGISGDGSLDKTHLSIIDPAGGTEKKLTFRQFAKVYGADDAVNMPFNVFYCP